MKAFYIFGKDRRFDLLSQRLFRDGYQVFREERETFLSPAAFVFPLGEKEERILSLLEKIPPESLVLLGKGTERIRLLCEDKGHTCVCLLEREDYLSFNCIATSEGTLAQIIQNCDRVLPQLKILVCGYGNCGREIARMLTSLDCPPHIFSRQGSMEKAKKAGFSLCPEPEKLPGFFDVVVNTVPAPIFSSSFFAALHPGSHFFQVASGTSGIDPEALKKRGISFHPLPGLPGKYSPATEAEAIDRVIRRLI